jgi:hypothetical protein
MAAPPPLPRNFPDRAIRDGLVRPDNLRAVLRQVAPEMADRLDYSRLEVVNRPYLLDDWRQRESDLLLCLPLLGGEPGEEVLICVLIEHHSSPDPVLPLRVLLYAVLHWEQQWREWERDHAYRVPLRLTPVLPVVFYTGPTPWTANRTLAELFAGPAEVRAWAPVWPARMWELDQHPAAELLQSGEWWWQAMAVVRAERAPTAEFEAVLVEALQHLQRLAAQDRVGWHQIVRMMLYWAIFRRPRREHARIIDLVRGYQASTELLQEMQTMSEQMEQTWEEELLARGEARGEARGAAAATLQTLREMLLAQLQERFQTVPEGLAQRIAAADLPALQRAILQFVRIQTPDELEL